MERATKDRSSLYRRSLRLAGLYDTHLFLPRPSETSAATNFFHETWHVLFDRSGARNSWPGSIGNAFNGVNALIVLLDVDRPGPDPLNADPSSADRDRQQRSSAFGNDALKDLEKQAPSRSCLGRHGRPPEPRGLVSPSKTAGVSLP